MPAPAPTPMPHAADRLPPAVQFRELTHVEDIRLVQEMERRVWAYDDIDVSPVPLLVALVKSGALLLGAFIDGQLRGFALSVPADRHGDRMHWSHMTGVDATLRGTGLGSGLKLEQARLVAARGYRRIQWTFDPLQSLNAHLNLVKLGAHVAEYVENVYGDSTSALHRGAPTDRFIADWDLDADGSPIRSPRLTHLNGHAGERAGTRREQDGWDVYEPATVLPNADVIRVPVPARFSPMLRDAPELATRWRLQTRAQFQSLFARGYEAVSFERQGDGGEYLLVLGE